MKIDKNGYSKCELCGASRPTAKMQAAETCSGCGAVSSMVCRGGCIERPRPGDERTLAEIVNNTVRIETAIHATRRCEIFQAHDRKPAEQCELQHGHEGACLFGSSVVLEKPQAYLVKPDEPPVPLSDEAMRVVVLQYREKVFAAFREWDMRPNDQRTWHDVVMGVDLP